MSEKSGTTRVTAALRSQLTLLESLESLSLRQRPLIEDEEPGPLLELLAARARIVEQLREGETALPEDPEAWDRLRSRCAASEREVVDVLLGECAGITERIAARDDEDRRSLTRRLDALGEQIAGLSKSKAAAGAYGARAEMPRFQDREA
ncbi:MAG: flagellar export chaperone FlgN [Phycisphaerales bacterium]|nr:flagellar export chaperone FlgN [Phycisphaerales bacterium]